MKSAQTKFIVALIASNVAFTSIAKAQQWGTGQWGGMQGCNYNYGPNAGANNESDEVQQLRRQEADLKQEQKEVLKEIREQTREKNALLNAINDALLPNWAGLFISHMDQNRNCCISGGETEVREERVPRRERAKRPPPSSSDNKQSSTIDPSEATRMPAADMPDDVDPWATGGGSYDGGGFSGSQGGPQVMCYPPEDPYTRPAWNRLACPTGSNGINPAVCTTPRVFQKPGISGELISKCREAIRSYAQISRELDTLEARKAEIASELRNLKKDLRQAIRDASEATCSTCVGGRGGGSGVAVRTSGGGFNWGNFLSQVAPIAAGAVVGGGLEYLNYQQNKANNSNLNKLGYPTMPYQFGNYMYPFVGMGMQYGAIAGSMNGGFGCSPGIGGGGFPYGPFGMGGPVGMSPYSNMGGPFGYPNGMMPGFPMLGGGAFNPGFAPWGMAGPWGNGGINPMLGGGFGGGFGGGLGGGFPMAGGFPGAGGFGGLPGAGLGGGLPGLNFNAGFGFGQPGFGLPGTGGYPGLGLGGGFPMAGIGSPMGASPFGGMPGIGGVGSPYNSITPFGSSPFGFNGATTPYGGMGNAFSPYADAQRSYYNNMVGRQIQGQQLYTRYYSLVNEIQQFNSGLSALTSPGLGIPNYYPSASVGFGIGVSGGLNYNSGLSSPWVNSAPAIYSPYSGSTGRSR